MIKHVVLLLNMLGIITLNSIFTSDVSIRTNIPAEVDAGGSFTAEIIIAKGALDKFARFKMDLPAGFKATPKYTANGEFSYQDQSVVFFWIKLPYEEEFTISFNVEVAPTAKGEFSLPGTFSYIEDNKRETITMEPQKINVVSSEYAETAQDDEAITFTYGNITEKGISCIRQKPYLTDNDEIVVNMLVNKGSISKFGKISETVPLGYRAENLKGKNSIFTFKNHEVKFSWLDLPADEQFVVSYKLIPETDLSDQAFILTGTFSYIGNEQLREIEVVERDIDLDNFQPSGLLAEAETVDDSQADEAQEYIVETPVEQTETEQVEEPVTEPVAEVVTKPDEQDVVVEEIKPDETLIIPEEKPIIAETTTPKTEGIKDERVNDVIATYTEKEYEPKLVSVPDPETGIAYRVQIAAGHRLVKPDYFKKQNIHDDVKVEIHEGWHKYTIGSYQIYKDARDYRIHIWNTTPIDDAFVAAYNYGTRITVQEALMVASQKWYK